MNDTWRRLLLLLVVGLAVCSYAIWRATRPGYEFPPPSEIDRMEAILKPGNRLFVVPADEYNEILAALSPSSYDGSGIKWQVMGELTIHAVDGTSFHMFLFDREGDPVGGVCCRADLGITNVLSRRQFRTTQKCIRKGSRKSSNTLG